MDSKNEQYIHKKIKRRENHFTKKDNKRGRREQRNYKARKQ